MSDIYSKRNRPTVDVDVYIYDRIPTPLRIQILYVFDAQIGRPNSDGRARDGTWTVYKMMVQHLREEYGVRQLWDTFRQAGAYSEFCAFLENEKSVDRVLDAVELGCRCIERITSKYNFAERSDASERATEAIEKINMRFGEHGIGYRYENSEIIRIDSTVLHSQIVKPALSLLAYPGFEPASQEFLSALEHHRHGREAEALNEALKALESAMKIICEQAQWAYRKDTDTAKNLIDICFSNGLLPKFWQNHMSGLRQTLESGVPTARNKLAGHGQGVNPTVIPPHLAAYVLHQTAASIVFLVEAHLEMRR